MTLAVAAGLTLCVTDGSASPDDRRPTSADAAVPVRVTGVAQVIVTGRPASPGGSG